jgi:hypothetical protein
MENHDSRNAHSPGASTDERASFPATSRTPDAGQSDTPADASPDAASGASTPPPRPADSRFASDAEERAYWAGVRIGMENAAAARAAPARAADPAHPHAVAPGEPCPEPPPLHSDLLNDMLADRIHDAVDESFPPGGRKPRHDGFTPEKMGEFLRHLASTGVVEHAAAAVGVSASAAYALRNRRGGRAFARMWDAILINRARDRLASDLSGRAIAGCVSLRKKDGVVVSEYHYHDNRLAMSVLSRLDRLAEKEADSEAHLRALSENMEEFIDCLAIGEDADAFVERRRPRDPELPPPLEGEPDPFPELTTMARLAGERDFRGVDPLDIPVQDLDPDDTTTWGAEEWNRAWRSGLMLWLEIDRSEGETEPVGRAASLKFDVTRDAASAAARLFPEWTPPPPEEAAAMPTADLDIQDYDDWTCEQRARASRSGYLNRVPASIWEDLAGIGEEE